MSDNVSAYVLDNGLNAIDTLADVIHICSAEPTVYSGTGGVVGTGNVSLGNKSFSAGGAAGAPTDNPPTDSRVATTAITSGSPGNVTASGNAAYMAIADSVNSRLYAVGHLTASTAVTNGGTFTLPSFNVILPNQ